MNKSDKDCEKGTDKHKWQGLWKTRILRGHTNKSDKNCEKLRYWGDRRTKVTLIMKN